MPTDPPVSSPPPTPRPAMPSAPDARDRLNQLAASLAQSRDAALLKEYLRLRSVTRF